MIRNLLAVTVLSLLAGVALASPVLAGTAKMDLSKKSWWTGAGTS